MKILIVLLLAFIAYSSAHVCKAEGDPHYRTFGGHAFNFYATGEFILFKRSGLQCNTRLVKSTHHWKGRSLNAGIACSANGVYFEVNSQGTNVHSYLNKQKNFKGKRTLRGVIVEKIGNNFSFKFRGMQMRGNVNNIPSGNLRHYLNIYVYSHHSGASGLCQGNKKKAARTLFHHGHVPTYRHGHKRRIKNKWIKWASKHCRNHFKKGSFSFNSCVTDMAASKRRRVAGQYEKLSKIIKGRFKKVCNGKHCHYYKRVTKVRNIRYAKHNFKMVTVIDHKKRSHAKNVIRSHKKSISNLRKQKEQQIRQTHFNANGKIRNFKREMKNADSHYKRTINKWNNWKINEIKSAWNKYHQTIRDINKWNKNIKRKAIKHSNNVIKHWNIWKARKIADAIKTAKNQIKKINQWKLGKFSYADNHRKNVVSNKKKWVNSRVSYSNNVRNTNIKKVSDWRINRIKYLKSQIKRANSIRNLKITRLRNQFEGQIKKHQAFIKHWYHISKTATKRVRRKHTTWHTRKSISHHWVHYHSHSTAQKIKKVPLFRYWNSRVGDHFYTTNINEIGTSKPGKVGKHGYVSEGIVGYVATKKVSGTTALFRYYNPGTSDHFYTTNWNELGNGRSGFKYEGIQCYVLKSNKKGAKALYRYYNGRDHFYTSNWSEIGKSKHGYKLEGKAGYVFSRK
eukprot:gene9076-1171_t